MSNPLVSVIIPAYNAEKVINEAMESIYAQTYRPIEIIVIDDGSADNTADIVKNYQTSKTNKASQTNETIKTSTISETGEISLLYIYQENSGPSKARNTGIKAGNGSYVAFLDADDLWTKDKLERQMQLFEKDPKIDIVLTDVKITRSKNNEIKETIMFQKRGLDKEFFGHNYLVLNPFTKLLKLNFIPTSSVVAKRSCFRDDIFFSDNRRYVEDWELWLKMSLYFNFGYINGVCVYKKEEGDGLSANFSKMLISQINILEEFVVEYIKDVTAQISLKELSRQLKDVYKWAGYHFMVNGEVKLARNYYKKSLKEFFDVKTLLYYLRSFLNN